MPLNGQTWIQAMSAQLLQCILTLGDLPFWQLAALAFLSRFGIECIPKTTTRWFGPGGAGLAMIAYFVTGLLRNQGEFAEALIALIRALLVYQVVWSALTAIDGAAWATLARCKALKLALVKFAKTAKTGAAEVRRIVESWEPPPPTPPSPPSLPAPPPPTRAERMQRLANAAQAEFEAEVALLDTLPLDEDEREVLFIQAKQRLLEKLLRLSEV